MLAPIYDLLFDKHANQRPSLELTEDQVAISYKSYRSCNSYDMQDIVDGKLTPGMITRKFRHFTLVYYLVASVLHGHQGQAEVAQTMVLDIFYPDNDELIFKNTYDHQGQPKQFKISRTDQNAPEELYFVHMEIKDMHNLPDQEERSYLIKRTTSLF